MPVKKFRFLPRRFWRTAGLLALSLGAVLISSSVQAAQHVNALIRVSLNIESGCVFSLDRADGGPLLAGDLDFGSHPRLDASAGGLTAQLVGKDLAMPLARLQCNPNVTYQLMVDGGVNNGSEDIRYLRSASGDDRIAYQLYSDAARQHVLGTAPLTRRAGPTPFDLTLYAKVIPQNPTPNAGHYQDTLRLTLSW